MEAPPPGAPWWCAAAPRAARLRQWEPPGGRSLVHFDWGKGGMLPGKNADFTDEIDDFGELWWFCQGTLLDFNEENEKNDDFTREHDNLIMDHGDLTRKCGKNCDVGILPGETWDFTGKIAILNGEIWSLPGKTYDEMWLLLGGHPLFVFSLL